MVLPEGGDLEWSLYAVHVDHQRLLRSAIVGRLQLQHQRQRCRDQPGDGIAGQTAGIFGVVNGVMYYDNNSLLGRAAITDNGAQPFPSAANTGPWRVTGTNAAVADPLTPLGLVACQFAGGNTYVHNDARVIDNGDGTLGWIFTLRNCDGSRKSQQIYYMQSADNGLTWSAPVGIVTGPVTIGGITLTGGFSLSDVVMVNGRPIVCFNAADAAGNIQVGGSPPPAAVFSPVPVDNKVALVLTACALLGTAALLMRGACRPEGDRRISSEYLSTVQRVCH
jgi:hypothetical protein